MRYYRIQLKAVTVIESFHPLCTCTSYLRTRTDVEQPSSVSMPAEVCVHCLLFTVCKIYIVENHEIYFF